MIGKTLGHYQITEKLGEGGMGVVYKAHDTHLDRFIAIKVLAAEKVADSDRKRRFVLEAKAASALNHPNIIHVYDIDQAEGTDFIAMEYVEGKTLDQLIPRKGMRLNDALKYSAQIADALAAAHAAGIVHRDLKPANVMVTDKGLVKVLDFGLAKLTERTGSDEFGTTETMEPRTEEGTIVGTVAYMSPEQAEGKKLDTRSDIFSFGSMLYEMLTGQRAFRGDTRASTIASILRDEPKSISEVAGAMPRDVEKLVRRCLQKDVLRRFQHMDDVKVALEELKEESESGVLEAALPAAARRASPAKYAVIAVAAVVLIAAGGYWLARQRPAEPEAPLIPVPLTSYSGWEDFPSFSPDGNNVAFQWAPEGPGTNYDIYIKQIGIEPPFRLTNSPEHDWGPAWSPDGKFIAFFRKSATGTALMLIPQRGGQERVLGEVNLPDGPDVYLAWTPDSKGVVLPWEEAGKADGGLYLISLETEERRRLTDNGGDGAPAVSPDGGVLAFSRKNGAGADLYLLRLGEGYKPEGEPEKVPSGIPYVIGVAWTPDGKDIVVCDESSGLWRMAASMSGRPTRLAFASDAAFAPAISRKGNRLAYAVRKDDWDIYRVDLSGQDLNPGVPFKFISSTRDEVRPTFSPDGKNIAFHSNRSGAWEVWVCDRDGSNAVQLTSLGGDGWDGSAWSPDGRRIAFGLVAAGKFQMYVVNASGGGARSLATAPSNTMFHPSWSRDGQSIYFRSDRSGSHEIWKMPAAGGDAVQITRNGADLPQVSPDGLYIYYLKPIRYPEECSVWRMPVGGGEETMVLDSTACHPSYAVWEQGIYFFTPSDKQDRKDLSLYEGSSTGRTRKIMTNEQPGAIYMAVSPDGRTILHTRTYQSGSDLMLVENFR
jgi:serine/threonine protein kinase/dipeptidyl aminopeptidase/acylaminoacyl peptidase